MDIKIGEEHEKYGKVERVECKKVIESTLKNNDAMSNDDHKLNELNNRHPRLKLVENWQNFFVSEWAEEEIEVHDNVYNHVEYGH